MSCDWYLFCVDCNERGLAGGDNTNHWSAEMRALANAAPELARFADLIERLRVGQMDPVLHIDDTTRLARPRIDLQWFKRHAGHRIVPMNEYGHLLGECAKPVDCYNCASRHYCTLKEGHDPPCDARAKRG